MMVLGMQVQPASIRGLPHFFSFSRTAAFGSDSSSGTGMIAATLMTNSSSFDGSQHKQAKATIPEIRPYHREAPTPPTRLSMFCVLPLDVLAFASFGGRAHRPGGRWCHLPLGGIITSHRRNSRWWPAPENNKPAHAAGV